MTMSSHYIDKENTVKDISTRILLKRRLKPVFRITAVHSGVLRYSHSVKSYLVAGLFLASHLANLE